MSLNSSLLKQLIETKEFFMGMYDNINYECVCPRCHNKVDGFQSKCAECVLDMLEPWQVKNFYSSCSVCGAWLEFDVEPPTEVKFVMRKINKPDKRNL